MARSPLFYQRWLMGMPPISLKRIALYTLLLIEQGSRYGHRMRVSAHRAGTGDFAPRARDGDFFRRRRGRRGARLCRAGMHPPFSLVAPKKTLQRAFSPLRGSP